MALNFPDNPTPGQQYTDPNGILWEYSGTVWNASINGPTIGSTGATGASGFSGYSGYSGAGADIAVYDQANLLTSSVSSFDFVGNGVVATNLSGAVTVTIDGGGSGGATGATGATGFGIDEYARTLAILALG